MSPQEFLKKYAERGHYGAEEGKLGQALFNAWCRADGSNKENFIANAMMAAHNYAKDVGDWPAQDAKQFWDGVKKSASKWSR